MDTLQSIPKRVTLECFLATIDIKDAYYKTSYEVFLVLLGK